eukprot:scaffold7031_cov118-Isochrysis_galbana.AAC.3
MALKPHPAATDTALTRSPLPATLSTQTKSSHPEDLSRGPRSLYVSSILQQESVAAAGFYCIGYRASGVGAASPTDRNTQHKRHKVAQETENKTEHKAEPHT